MKPAPILFAATLGLAALALTACKPETAAKRIEDMNPAEVEALVKELEAACRRQGVELSSRAYDDCIRAEGVKRGLVQ